MLLRSYAFVKQPMNEGLAAYLLAEGCKLDRIDKYVVEAFEALIYDKITNKINWNNVIMAQKKDDVKYMQQEVKKVFGYVRGIKRKQELNKRKKGRKVLPIVDDAETEKGISEDVVAYMEQTDEYEVLLDRLTADSIVEEIYKNRDRIQETYGFDIIEELKATLDFLIKNKVWFSIPDCVKNLEKLEKKEKVLWNDLRELLHIRDGVAALFESA